MRPEDFVDRIANFHRASYRDTSGHSLPLRLRESSGVRAPTAPYGPSRLMALPLGE